MAATKEVETFLSDMGLESCVQAVVHNGFYTSSRNMQPQACTLPSDAVCFTHSDPFVHLCADSGGPTGGNL
jgi:hypothetical protein